MTWKRVTGFCAEAKALVQNTIHQAAQSTARGFSRACESKAVGTVRSRLKRLTWTERICLVVGGVTGSLSLYYTCLAFLQATVANKLSLIMLCAQIQNRGNDTQCQKAATVPLPNILGRSVMPTAVREHDTDQHLHTATSTILSTLTTVVREHGTDQHLHTATASSTMLSTLTTAVREHDTDQHLYTASSTMLSTLTTAVREHGTDQHLHTATSIIHGTLTILFVLATISLVSFGVVLVGKATRVTTISHGIDQWQTQTGNSATRENHYAGHKEEDHGSYLRGRPTFRKGYRYLEYSDGLDENGLRNLAYTESGSSSSRPSSLSDADADLQRVEKQLSQQQQSHLDDSDISGTSSVVASETTLSLHTVAPSSTATIEPALDPSSASDGPVQDRSSWSSTKSSSESQLPWPQIDDPQRPGNRPLDVQSNDNGHQGQFVGHPLLKYACAAAANYIGVNNVPVIRSQDENTARHAPRGLAAGGTPPRISKDAPGGAGPLEHLDTNRRPRSALNEDGPSLQSCQGSSIALAPSTSLGSEGSSPIAPDVMNGDPDHVEGDRGEAFDAATTNARPARVRRKRQWRRKAKV